MGRSLPLGAGRSVPESPLRSERGSVTLWMLGLSLLLLLFGGLAIDFWRALAIAAGAGRDRRLGLGGCRIGYRRRALSGNRRGRDRCGSGCRYRLVICCVPRRRLERSNCHHRPGWLRRSRCWWSTARLGAHGGVRRSDSAIDGHCGGHGAVPCYLVAVRRQPRVRTRSLHDRSDSGMTVRTGAAYPRIAFGCARSGVV